MDLKFTNWEKYNKRRGGIKTPVWFAFNDKFFIDPIVMEMNNEEKLVLIFLLCEASQQNANGALILSETKFSRLTGINTKHLYSSIDKLLKSGAATAPRSGRVHHTTQQDMTRHYKTLSCANLEKTVANTPETVFNLDELYQLYPLKKGKALGLEKLKRVIKSQKDFDDFKLAILRYIEDIKSKGTEARFIKQFSTFVGSDKVQPWRDWLDEDAGIGLIPKAERDFSFLKD